MHAVTMRTLAIVLCAAAFAGCASAPAERAPAAPAASTDVPVEFYRLDNGLRVVLSRDTSVPTVTWPSTTTSASASSRRTAPASRTCSST
jgi:hypothetical protein